MQIQQLQQNPKHQSPQQIQLLLQHLQQQINVQQLQMLQQQQQLPLDDNVNFQQRAPIGFNSFQTPPPNPILNQLPNQVQNPIQNQLQIQPQTQPIPLNLALPSTIQTPAPLGPPRPYYDLPAGIMVSLCKVSFFFFFSLVIKKKAINNHIFKSLERKVHTLHLTLKMFQYLLVNNQLLN